MNENGRREPIVVTWEHGLRFGVDVRGHHLVVDQPAGAGGADAGPMPLELLGASLGSCIALYVRQFCDARSLPCDGMRVEVRQHGARNPGRIARFEVDVVMPEPLPPQYSEMLERVVRSCPAHHTLEGGAEVGIVVRQPARV